MSLSLQTNIQNDFLQMFKNICLTHFTQTSFLNQYGHFVFSC